MTRIYLNEEPIETSASTVLEYFQQNGIEISAFCGGNGKCGKCLVEVDQKLSLACKTKLEDGMRIHTIQQKHESVIMDNPIEVALDLGTTTIAARITNKEQIQEIQFYNPLVSFGGDVISRIQYIQQHHNGLNLLHTTLCNGIKKRLNCYGKVVKMVVSGNTIMQHIFANISPVSIASYPFNAQTLFRENKIYQIEAFPDCQIVLVPCIASYVGGDIASGLLACQLEENSLFIDVGTNAEIVLNAKGKLYACSAAAGPAFEGAELTCGSNQIETCITHFFDDKEIGYESESEQPTGISGSGYLDLLALLLNRGILDESGCFNEIEDIEEKYQSNLREDEEGNLSFWIDSNLYINNKDIRMLQMAIAAISGAIATLFIETGITADQLKKVYISGNFGSHLNMKSVITIGLLPKELFNKEVLLNNSSLIGATLILNNASLLEAARKISESTKYIELSESGLFKKLYIEHMELTEDKVWNYISH